MRYELKRIAPLRAANIGALVYGLLVTFFAIVFAPILLVVSMFAPREETGLGGPLVALGLLILYPIMGLVMGWISGLFSSVIYNLIINLTGGLILELEGTPPNP